LEAELKKSLPTIEISLISSGGGVFEVVLDEKLIFSKKALNRFQKEFLPVNTSWGKKKLKKNK
jgi:predicted Rdx family selenoprotein